MSQLDLFDNSNLSRTTDPETSKAAGVDVEPKLSGLRAEFVFRLRLLGRPATAQEVADGVESIRKRAKECGRLGLVRVVGTKRCSITGKSATTYWVV